MRIKAPCATCMTTKEDYRLELLDGELDDSGLIYVSCRNGHSSNIVFNARRYEILMQSATSALLDGYTNEAISTYATALERIYEFYIRVLLRSRSIGPGVSEQAWKLVSAQSERQLGAFHFLYLIDEGHILELAPEISEIRNRIVHRGKIAKSDEALRFAKLIYERIRSIEVSLSKHTISMSAEQEYEIEAQKNIVPKDTDYVVLESFFVKIDKSGEAAGHPETFTEYLAAVHQGKESGWI